jgi:RNA polymerase sigma-70 factor (ECF subfamily)
MEPDRDDDALLVAAADDAEAFAAFYRGHVRGLLAYFRRRVGSAELAADLTAETFAAALEGRHRYAPERGPAAAWLYGIARRQLVTFQRRATSGGASSPSRGAPPSSSPARWWPRRSSSSRCWRSPRRRRSPPRAARRPSLRRPPR